MDNDMLYWRNLRYLMGYALCKFQAHPNPFHDFSYRCTRCHVHIYNGQEKGFML